MAVQMLGPVIAIGGFRWSGAANALEFGAEAATKDVTTFDHAANGFEASTAGLKSLFVQTTGMADYAVGGLDEWLRSGYGIAQVFSCAPVGDTAGNIGQLANGNVLPGYRAFNAQVGEVSMTTAELKGGLIAEGLVTQGTGSTITATGHTTAVNVGALTSGRTMYASVHAVSVTGTTPSATFQLESAATSGGSYTLRGSAGSALTAAGGQLLSTTTTTTDAWWKLAVTVSGTSPVFTVLAVIALV